MTLSTTYTRSALKSDFLTNGYLTGNQLAPDVLGLSNGGFVSAYNNAEHAIVLDFYDASFSIIAGQQTPFSGATKAAGQPSLTQLTNGNVLVVWDDNAPESPGLRGHLFSPTGASIGSELTLGTSDFGYADPQVAALAAGGFVISYTFGSVVAFARYDDNGGLQSSSLVSTTGTDSDSAVAALIDGGFVVTHTDVDESSDPTTIYAALYNADGSGRYSRPYADFVLHGSFNSTQTQSKVVGLLNDNFAVVYTDSFYHEGGTLGDGISLWIGAFDTNGNLSDRLVHVNTTSTVDESDPDVTVLANGFILVTWTHPFSSTDHDIYGRVFDQDGNAVTIGGSSAEFVITSSGTDDTLSAVSHLTGGKFITSWQDSESDGNGGGIHSTASEITRATVGDSANDTFAGDQLNDIFTGGAGDDRFVYAPGGGHDTWTDFTAGAGTQDKVDLTAFSNIHNLAGLLAHATQNGANTVLDFGNGNTLTLQNVAKAALSADDFILMRRTTSRATAAATFSG